MTTQQTLVAIVDDDPILREALERWLEICGYAVELYASGAEFLDAAMISRVGCLVLDVQLGDTTGLDLARQLAAGGRKLPIIFMTGSTEATFQRQAMDLGCTAFLYKPFPPGQLIEAIVAATGQRPESDNQ